MTDTATLQNQIETLQIDNAFLSLTQGFGMLGSDRTLDFVPTVNRVPRQQEQYDGLFEANNYAANIVEYLPDAMGQAHPKYTCDNADVAAWIQKQIDGVMPYFVRAEKIARQTGGSGIFIGAADGQKDISEPLNESTLSKIEFLSVIEGGIHGMLQVDSIEKNPQAKGYGEPLFFRFKNTSQLIHRSRILPFYGAKLLTREQQRRYKYWGMSILERPLTYLRTLEIADQAIANTISQFSRLIVEIPNLDLLLETPDGRTKLKKYQQLINQAWNVLKMLPLAGPKDGTPASKVYNLKTDYNGLSPILQHFKEQLAGSADIPYGMLFNSGAKSGGLGTSSSSGSTSSDRTEERKWAEYVHRCQETEWRQNLEYLIRLWHLSMMGMSGRKLPESQNLEFPSILQLSEGEKRSLDKSRAEEYKTLVDAQIATPTEAAKAIQKNTDIGSAIDLEARQPQPAKLMPTMGGGAIALPMTPAQNLLPAGPTGDSDRPYLIFFKGRRTGIGVRASSRSEAISKAREKKKRGGDEVGTVRLATASEQKTAANGGWVRNGPNGEKPGYSPSKRGYGPKPQGDSEDAIVLLIEDDATPAQRILKWQGFEIGLQYFPYQKRHGRTLTAGYGHLRRTKGADGMALDCYVGSDLTSDKIFAVEQLIDGQFDEEKIILGCQTKDEARSLYLANMPIEMFGGIRELTMRELDSYRVSEDVQADWLETDYSPSQRRDSHGRFAGGGGGGGGPAGIVAKAREAVRQHLGTPEGRQKLLELGERQAIKFAVGGAVGAATGNPIVGAVAGTAASRVIQNRIARFSGRDRASAEAIVEGGQKLSDLSRGLGLRNLSALRSPEGRQVLKEASEALLGSTAKLAAESLLDHPLVGIASSQIAVRGTNALANVARRRITRDMDDTQIEQIQQALQLLENGVSASIKKHFGLDVAEFGEYDHQNGAIVGQVRIANVPDLVDFEYSKDGIKLNQSNVQADAIAPLEVTGEPLSDSEFDQFAEIDFEDVLATLAGVLGGDK